MRDVHVFFRTLGDVSAAPSSELRPRPVQSARLVLATLHRTLTGAAVRARGSSLGFTPAWANEWLEFLAQAVRSLPTRRLTACIHISGIAAWLFAWAIIHSAFRGYDKFFERMQRGQHNYTGHMADLRAEYSGSTFFMGILMSTVVMGWIACYVVLLLLLVPVMMPQVHQFVWSFRVQFVVLGLTKSIVILLRMAVCDRFLNEKGEIHRPIAFSVVWVVLIVLNFSLGLLGAIFRVAFVFPILIYRFNMLDETMVNETFVSMDLGYHSLLTLTYTTHERSNPIRCAFISLIGGAALRKHGVTHRTAREVVGSTEYGPAPDRPPDGPGASQEATASQREDLRRRCIVRNRWWLYVNLARDRRLLQFRRPGKIDDLAA